MIAPGTRFTRLTVVEPVADVRAAAERRRYYLCRCDCGNTRHVRGTNLKTGHTRSCGCLARERVRDRVIKHGHCIADAHTPEYEAWLSMREMCYDPSCSSWEFVGRRGIRVWPKWRHDFARFYADAGRRPGPEHRLGRKDHKRSYVPGNVEWQSRHKSGRSRIDNRFFTVGKITLCLQDWSECSRINKSTLHYRLSKGLTMREAIARGTGHKGNSGVPLS